MGEFEKVELKLAQARVHCNQLEQVDSAHDFYRLVNSFLSATRSTISVLGFQFGLKERRLTKRAKQSTFSVEQIKEMDRFDDWFRKESRVVLSHPLKRERDESEHRSGQPGFRYHPKPGPGMSFHSGTAFMPARMNYGKGRMGLPMRDQNAFVYVMADGTHRAAIEVCKEFLGLVEELVRKARSHPW